MKKIGFIIALMFLMMPSFLNADDYQKSDKFFDNNSAVTPLKKGQDNFKKGSLFERISGFFGNKNVDKKSSLKSKKENAQGISDTPKDLEFISGNKIISLGLVVNAINMKHFSKNMEKLRTTIDDYDLDAGHVYLNGFANDAIDPIIVPLIARGAPMSFHFSIPEQFNISLSPTWIIQTSEGRILLEGVSNLNRYINKKGEFVEKGIPIEQRAEDHEDSMFKGGSIFSE